MKVKTSELKGAALDWAVAMATGKKARLAVGYATTTTGEGRSFLYVIADGVKGSFEPSTNWGQGGPIFEKFCVGINFDDDGDAWKCLAYFGYDPEKYKYASAHDGSSKLKAFCKAFVKAAFGTRVEIPDELCEAAP